MKRKSSIGAGNTPATWQPEAKQSFDPFKYLDYVPGTVSSYRMAKRKKVTLGGMALVAYVLQIGGRFNAANVLLPAGAVYLAGF